MLPRWYFHFYLIFAWKRKWNKFKNIICNEKLVHLARQRTVLYSRKLQKHTLSSFKTSKFNVWTPVVLEFYLLLFFFYHIYTESNILFIYGILLNRSIINNNWEKFIRRVLVGLIIQYNIWKAELILFFYIIIWFASHPFYYFLFGPYNYTIICV